MRTKIELLLDLLDRAYAKSRCHSLRTAARDVTEPEALWTPPHFEGFPFMNGSIRDLVFHVGADKLVQISQRFADGAVTWETMTARFAREGRTLAAALTIAEEGHGAVRSTLASLIDDDLVKKTTLEGRAMRNVDFFAMMIEHDAYHAGQIRYVRNMIEGPES